MTLSRRDSEFLLFDQVYRAAVRGTGAVLLLSGPVGTGKTALLQAMGGRAARQGGWCFVITGSARERGHRFGVLDRLIQAMCAAGMRQPFPDGLDCGENFYAMMGRVHAAIRDMAGGRPVLIGIDDVHFADEQSLRCLSYLIRRVESSGVVMVLTESSSYERDMADLRAETLHLPFCHRFRLAPLTPSDIAEQMRERFGAVADTGLVRFLAEVSGGIPLLLHALMDDQAAGRMPDLRRPGPHYRQAVLRSLHRCAPSTAAIAHAIAMLGARPLPELIAELGDVDPALVCEGARDLREMGLLGSESFRHPLTRSAVLADIPLPELSAMHGRAAELLHESGAPAGAVAEHLIAAQDGGRAGWRVAILCEAAREALAAGDVDTAVTSLRHAVGASADDGQRVRAGVLLAEAQWHGDPSRAARRLRDLSRDGRAGLLTEPDLLIVVNQLLWWGEFAEADELLRAGDGGGDSALGQLWTFFCRAGLGSEPCDESGQAVESPLAQSGPMAAVTYLSSAAGLAFGRVEADRADRMLWGIQAGTTLTPALYALVVLVQTGRLEEAVAWCDRLLKEDWIHRAPMRRVLIETVKAVAAMRGGDSETALRCVREVFEAVPPPAWGVVAGLPLSIAIRASTDLGDADSAWAYLAVPVPPAMLDTPFALPYLQALGRYHLAMKHPESTTMYSRSCVELMKRWGVDEASAAAMLAEFESPSPSPLPVPEGRADEALLLEDDHFRWGPDAELTTAERRVAVLAASGETNRQIAERLFITVSTVEQHLTKVYRKLNVRNRFGLREYLPLIEIP
ncbi:helix-turn-helix transcriptional regulator [Actinoplanes regularis]|uniref:Regulatory protein, luxR family n=1 Tax=Actinoplanes regularis TaxID=52697 RepID=A0A239IMX2_9ACTN|nr:LuxR family transcriptional regulator [Actinoplanes regularis]GIE91444.1 hypothetical protein Are01nite_79240 [Actinoplanes regularis]SNS95020.1 regulatory protein, luxR family [Actinoplanes regularis]